MVNKKNIRKWIKALRSGKYIQITGNLHKDNGYCCLGVACEVSGLSEWKRKDLPFTLNSYFYLDALNTLPDPVQKWLGVENCNPTCNGRFLSDWNDSQFYNFTQIADLIEERYLTNGK